MTMFLHRSHAGESYRTTVPGPVVPAAVWEPSCSHGYTVSGRSVRTLRPADRTQGRARMGVQGRPDRWQDTGLAYLLGALLGLAVVGGLLLGAGDGTGAGYGGYPADGETWTSSQVQEGSLSGG